MKTPKNGEERLLFVPLGGSGEIGMNLNLYGFGGKWLMVDLGMSFADDSTPGCDLIFPDPSFIAGLKDDLLGIVLTHGHEDHIGAVPHLWDQLRVPMYATPFTALLVEDKLQEFGLSGIAEVNIVKPGQKLTFGDFDVTYVPLAHSIAEGNGLIIETPLGTVFHTGDWKLDDNPLIGPECPSDVLTKLGDKGVMAMVGDSTNVFNERASGSEGDVRENLMELVGGLEGRVMITTFASNVARLKTIGEVAKAHDRDVVLLGRSMHRIYKIARETGYLDDFPRVIDEEHADSIPKDKILFMSTGCQGEYRAALSRVARGEHRNVTLTEGDTVIFSSKMIPGNEISLGHLFNQLAEAKVDVITEKDAFVHVSGHPGQEELAAMYGWVRPETAIPVHGEARHLKKHKEFALTQGVKRALAPKNGDIIQMAPDGPKVIDQAPFGRLTLDGKVLVAVNAASVVERRRISQNGQVSVSLMLDSDGALMIEPLAMAHGLPGDVDSVLDLLVDAAETGVEKMKARDRLDDAKIDEAVRIHVRRATRKELGKNPLVDVLITREDDL